MSFLSRGSRFLLDKLPDDYVYLKSSGAKMRNFEEVLDPRCWSCSAVLRHQHLIDLMSEKVAKKLNMKKLSNREFFSSSWIKISALDFFQGRRQPENPIEEKPGEEIVSEEKSTQKTVIWKGKSLIMNVRC